MEEWSEREVNIAADLREVDFAKSESSKPERGWRIEDGECQGKDINRVIFVFRSAPRHQSYFSLFPLYKSCAALIHKSSVNIFSRDSVREEVLGDMWILTYPTRPD